MGGSTELGDTYLYSSPYMYYNFSFRPVVLPHLLGSYFNAFNAIKNQNIMQQSGIALEKYWVT